LRSTSLARAGKIMFLRPVKNANGLVMKTAT